MNVSVSVSGFLRTARDWSPRRSEGVSWSVVGVCAAMQLKLSSDEGWPMPWADTPWPNCLVLIPGACFLWLLRMYEVCHALSCVLLCGAKRVLAAICCGCCCAACHPHPARPVGNQAATERAAPLPVVVAESDHYWVACFHGRFATRYVFAVHPVRSVGDGPVWDEEEWASSLYLLA